MLWLPSPYLRRISEAMFILVYSVCILKIVYLKYQWFLFVALMFLQGVTARKHTSNHTLKGMVEKYKLSL